MVLGDSVAYPRSSCGDVWCSNAVPRPGGSGEIMDVVRPCSAPHSAILGMWRSPLAQPFHFPSFLFFPTRSQRAAETPSHSTMMTDGPPSG